MNRKIYWGLGVLLLFFGGFMFYVHLDYAKFRENLEEKRPKLDVVDTEVPKKEEDTSQVEEPIVDVSDDTQQNTDVLSNKSGEDQLLSPLTSKELDKLYQQISTELSKMDSDEEVDRGLDLTQYTQRQIAHLYSVGIDLSKLPEKLADKITAHQYRKDGVPPPTEGEITITNVKRTPRGGLSVGGSGQLLPGETEQEFTQRMIKAAEKKLSESEN